MFTDYPALNKGYLSVICFIFCYLSIFAVFTTELKKEMI